MENELFKALKAIDVDVEESLERFMEDEEMYLKYIKRFPTEKNMKKLREAVEQADYKQAEDSIHALKGIADNLGFVDFVDAAVDMLYEFRHDKKEEGMRLLPEVEKEYQKICDVINSFPK